MIIAIDGPAGSGKSTTARAVARRLGFFYIDTGAMYRTVALLFQRQGLEPDAENVESVLADFDLDMDYSSAGARVRLSGTDVTSDIRRPEVTQLSSRVSALVKVRERMVEEQRRLADEQTAGGRGVVLEGRDIGTVVFPAAELKIFLTADLAVRAQRRAAQMSDDVRAEDLQREMATRDHNDSTRDASPLTKALDAVELDTTTLDFQEQVAAILSLVAERS